MPTVSDRSRLISIVQSRQNARVRELRAAFVRSGREVSEVIGIEGEHLIAEALRSGVRLRTVFLRRDPAAADKDRRDSSLRILDRLAAALPPSPSSNSPPPSSTAPSKPNPPRPSPPSLSRRAFPWPRLSPDPNPLIVLTAALQDPGNFGTLIRSAEAFGASGVIALPGTVSLWNSKALRASAGSVFRVPVISEKSSLAFAALAERGIPFTPPFPRPSIPTRFPAPAPTSPDPSPSSSATKAAAFLPNYSTAPPPASPFPPPVPSNPSTPPSPPASSSTKLPAREPP